MTATTEPIELETTSEPEDRNERLRVETGKLRTRKGLPVDKWFQLGGGVFLCVGLLAIVAGAYGVSHTARTWRQTPYVVSGGLLGLALVFIGGFAYFAFWLTKLVEQGNAQIAVLERIEMRLGGDRKSVV